MPAYMPYLILLLSSLLAVAGQILFKLGAQNATHLGMFINPRLFFGLCAYGSSTLLWIFALSKLPLNIAYAFTALTFLLVYTLSAFYLHEAISLQGWLGLAAILVGFLLLVTSR